MVVVDVESNCDCAYPGVGGKGTTIWLSDDVTIGPRQEYVWSFTDTKPDCYDQISQGSGTQLSIITYEIATTGLSTIQSFAIDRYLNGVNMGSTVHSDTAGHNVTEAFDLTQVPPAGTYNQNGLNTVRFFNTSFLVPVQINKFRVIRAYAIWGLTPSSQDNCLPTQTVGTSGTLDNNRQDYPCNYANYGERISYVHYGANYSISVIHPGEAGSWTFTHPQSSTDNYLYPYVCLFNFNNTMRGFDPLNPEGLYVISLNGEDNVIAKYYHGSTLLLPSQFPTVDLAQSQYYHDEPGATNTVRLYNAGTVDLRLDTGSLGGVDIYRFYKVKSICKDYFDNNNITNYFWDQTLFHTTGAMLVREVVNYK